MHCLFPHQFLIKWTFDPHPISGQPNIILLTNWIRLHAQLPLIVNDSSMTNHSVSIHSTIVSYTWHTRAYTFSLFPVNSWMKPIWKPVTNDQKWNTTRNICILHINRKRRGKNHNWLCNLIFFPLLSTHIKVSLSFFSLLRHNICIRRNISINEKH